MKMSTLDIRDLKFGDVTGIRFDDSTDRLINDAGSLGIDKDGDTVTLCDYDELDDFIAACQKAKELWAK